MQIFRDFKGLPDDVRGAAIAVGNFDGVHQGHAAVINEAGRVAKADGRPWAVLTFEPHPRQVFQPDIDPFRLTPSTVKERLIHELGVDALIVLTFDRDFSQRQARDFVQDILIDSFDAYHVVSGYDFAFGHKRQGNCELLLRMGNELGFGFTAVPAFKDEKGETFSSTRIRESLQNGDPQSAARLLGRPFTIEGPVEHGEERGRQIGFPTANVALSDYLRPASGVYAVQAGLGVNGEWLTGVANLGQRPTFAGDDVVLEVHLLDFDEDLYDQTLRVAFIDYLRPEKKFDGLESLKAQIASDCDQARTILAKS